MQNNTFQHHYHTNNFNGTSNPKMTNIHVVKSVMSGQPHIHRQMSCYSHGICPVFESCPVIAGARHHVLLYYI